MVEKYIPKRSWSLAQWSEGYIIKARQELPRFIVYLPEHPNADKRGRVKRAHAVWWLTHNKTMPPRGYVIHHCNHDSLDDRPFNLQVLTISEHSRLHHEKHAPITLVCPVCNKTFTVQYNILSQHFKEGRKVGQKYCSPLCASTARRGKRGHSPRGMTIAKVRRLRKLREDGRSLRELALLFGLSLSGVSAIANRQNWKDV